MDAVLKISIDSSAAEAGAKRVALMLENIKKEADRLGSGIKIDVDGSKARYGTNYVINGLKDVQKEAERTARSAKVVGDSFMRLRDLAMGLRGAMAVVGVGTGFSSMVSTIADFEQRMSNVKAVTQAGAEDMARMQKVARDLGATTKFSASEAAEGMVFLGQAGFDTSQIIQSMKPVLDLAAAGAMDLGRASEIAAAIMGGFKLQASDMTNIADTLAAAAASGALDLQDLGMAMKYVGPVASTLGVSLGDTAAAMVVLSNNGIKGEMAGTALRGVFASLIDPTKQAEKEIAALGITFDDLSPKSNTLSQIIDKLRKAGLDASMAFKLFGQEGAPAILSLVANNGELAKTSEEMKNVTDEASRMAKVMSDNLRGDFATLASAVQELTLQVGEGGLLGGLRSLTQTATGVVRVMAGMEDTLGDQAGYYIALTEAIKGLAAAFATIYVARTLAPMLSSMATAASAATASMTKMGVAARVAAVSMGLLRGAMAFLGGPIGVAITAIGAAIYYLSNRTKDAEKSQKVFNDRMEKLVGINAQLSTASGNRRVELETERQQVLKNADAEYALAEARLASLRAFQESGKKTIVDAIDSGAKRLDQALGFKGAGVNDTVDAASNLPGMGALGSVLGVTAGDMKLDTTNKQIDDTTAALASLADQRAKLREEAAKPIPALASSGGGAGAGVPPGGSGANPGIPIDEGELNRKVGAYKNATSEIINQTSKMAYVSQQVSGGDYAMEEAGMRYDLMEKAKEAGLYTSSEVENIKQVAAEYRRVSEEADNLRQSEEDKNNAISRSDEIWRSTLSPLEEYQIKLAELQDLHQQWIDTNGEVGISQSTLTAATKNLRDEINGTSYEGAIDQVQKYNDEVKKLLDLQQLYQDTNGELGLSPERAGDALGALADSMNSEGAAVFDETRTAAERYAIEIDKLNALHQLFIQTNGALGISQETLARGMELAAKKAAESGSELQRLASQYGDVGKQMENVAMGAALNLEDSLVDIAMGAKSAKEAFADFARSTAEMLMRTAIQMAIIRPLLMGLGAGFAGGGVMTPSGPMSLPMYAKGGVMSSLGDLPLKTYSAGGIADSPQVAIFGEGKMPEAYVPLPDGRRIPVKMEGGGGQGGGSGMSIVNNINVNMPQGAKQEDGDRFGQAIARQVEDAMNANLMKQQRPGGLLDPYGYGT